MEFNEIKLITISCPDCNTSISIKYSGERSDGKKFQTFICPCCGHDLSTYASSAVHYAYEYNEICKKISEFKQKGIVKFEEFEEFE